MGEWIGLIAVIMLFSIPLAAILAKSPIGEAIAARLRGERGDNSALESRIEELENRLTNQKRADALRNKIGEEETARIRSEYGQSQGTVTILFSDIEDFTRFVDRGDELAHEILQIHNKIIRDQIRKYEGREVKNYGDGFMVSFSSARNAVQCALDIQEIFKTYNFRHADPIRVRIGIHSGEPIKDHDDYIGRSVNLAARIADEARGGEIWTSDLVKQLVGPSRDFQFVPRGEHQLQGFSENQHLCEVVRIEALESPETRELEDRLREIEEKIRNDQKE